MDSSSSVKAAQILEKISDELFFTGKICRSENTQFCVECGMNMVLGMK